MSTSFEYVSFVCGRFNCEEVCSGRVFKEREENAVSRARRTFIIKREMRGHFRIGHSPTYIRRAGA